MLDPPLTQFTRRPDRLLPYRPFTVVESSPPLTEGVGRGHNYYIEKEPAAPRGFRVQFLPCSAVGYPDPL